MANYTERVREDIGDLIEKRKEDLHRHVLTYKRLFMDKKVTYYFFSKGVPKRRTVYFYKKNFMHLCGVSNYEKGWQGFYKDCMHKTLKPETAKAIKREFVEPKIDAMEGLPKLLERGVVGFSDDSVVHKSTNYGEMVRTQEDLLALGTIKDRTTQNQVPISLINLEVSTDGMIKATSNWCKVSNIRVEPIHGGETAMYPKDREYDRVMKEKTDKAVRENRQKQEEKLRKKREMQSKADKERNMRERHTDKTGTTPKSESIPKKQKSNGQEDSNRNKRNLKRRTQKNQETVTIKEPRNSHSKKSRNATKKKDRSKGVRV